MRPRRSRISRICRRLARRSPNRKSQWQEIGSLRPHGSVGYPVGHSESRAYASYTPPPEPAWGGARDTVLEPAFGTLHENPAHPEPIDAGSSAGKVALFATFLFLLACGYAGMSGYLLTYRPSLSGFGIFGAVAALLMAGIGMGMAVSRPQNSRGGQVLAFSSVWLSLWFGLMILMCVRH